MKQVEGWGGMAGRIQHYYRDYRTGQALCGHTTNRIYIPHLGPGQRLCLVCEQVLGRSEALRKQGAAQGGQREEGV